MMDKANLFVWLTTQPHLVIQMNSLQSIHILYKNSILSKLKTLNHT